MRDEEIFPRLATVLGRVVACMLTPRDGNVPLSEHLRIVHFVLRFWFQHVDRIGRFGNEVWLVFGMVRSPLIENLKLAFCRFEPPLRFALKNHSELPLGI